jgi:hypothetical protein
MYDIQTGKSKSSEMLIALIGGDCQLIALKRQSTLA